MDPTAAALHLLNFMAPALGVALLLACMAALCFRGAPCSVGFLEQVAVSFAVGLGVCVAGLVLTGRDGKMLTYAALVAACGTVQWALTRGWR
ncbi:hypothetical protein C8241_16625 [Paracidovorax avenae]|uniref:hypothetical protein n=1 Tax=Paracidovorax avenae TaxID=80867 RepID=UPI0006B38539|nr:hypothetical protein [Paracidovorax avenae]AVS63086.1 hypothetical protein C8241_16625 [Paracidovorax avenae]